MTSVDSQASDNRDAFRIDKDIHFEFLPCSASSAQDKPVESMFDDDDDGTRLIGDLANIDRDMLKILGAIRDKNRFLGDALKAMNAKIDVIGRHIAFNSESSLRSRPKTRVNISNDGIGFISERSFYVGNIIAMRMIFLPNYTMACTYGKVVRCVQKGEKFQVAARFHNISDRDHQVVARILLKSQAETNKQNVK